MPIDDIIHFLIFFPFSSFQAETLDLRLKPMPKEQVHQTYVSKNGGEQWRFSSHGTMRKKTLKYHLKNTSKLQTVDGSEIPNHILGSITTTLFSNGIKPLLFRKIKLRQFPSSHTEQQTHRRPTASPQNEPKAWRCWRLFLGRCGFEFLFFGVHQKQGVKINQTKRR